MAESSAASSSLDHPCGAASARLENSVNVVASTTRRYREVIMMVYSSEKMLALLSGLAQRVAGAIHD